ncbi:hypothetical protein DFH11DRAFT_1559005 [Phellopilus nigrolimitatus]|nr:hypothetical protein DFH11DRAFT_1559005 [Phellopilus nigrolimitatus]
MFPRGIQRTICRPCMTALQRTSWSNISARPRTVQRLIHVSRPLMATPPPMVKVSDVSTERYHQLSDVTMDTLLVSLETLLDDVGNLEYEVEYSSGVLTLNLADKGTYVINKQPPNKQIWLSSPFSGPKRYDYVAEDDGWYYLRDGQSIETLLDEELGKALNRKVKLGLEEISSKVA